ncbi:MAG: hypothetical protein ACRDF6_10685 [bacterium]
MKKLLAGIILVVGVLVASSVSWGQELGVTWEMLEGVTWEVFESVTWE